MKKYNLKINNKEYKVEVLDVDETSASVKVNDVVYDVEVDRQIKSTKTPKLTRSAVVPSTDVEVSTAKTAKPDAIKTFKTIKCPLPGKILDIMVKEGDHVSVGQPVICLEAMKMENNINADKEGTVAAIKVNKNDTVMEGDVLIEIG